MSKKFTNSFLPLLLKLFAMSVSNHSRVCRKPESTSSWYMTWLPIVLVSIAIQYFSPRKAMDNTCWRARIASLERHWDDFFRCLNGNRVQRQIASIQSQNWWKRNRFAWSRDAKQGGNRCSYTGKGQRGSEQGAIPRRIGNDQNSHCARRGQWKLRKDHAVSEH